VFSSAFSRKKIHSLCFRFAKRVRNKIRKIREKSLSYRLKRKPRNKEKIDEIGKECKREKISSKVGGLQVVVQKRRKREEKK
jgi:hypothetical protein